MEKIKLERLGYVVADLKRIGPTNQTLNIIRYSGAIDNCVVITLFNEGPDSQINEYLQYGIKVICLSLNRKTCLINGPQKLRSLMRREKIIIAHSWGTYADWITFRACKKTNIKHLITLRNYPIEDATTRMNYLKGLAVAYIELDALKHTRNILACSISIMQKMNKKYSWSHIGYIQNGVNTDKFSVKDKTLVREKYGFDPNAIVLISTGSMIPRKRISETVDAFNIAILNNNNLYLWLFGDGPLLKKMKEKYGNNSHLKFMGKVTDINERLNASDVFVSSSESEGMPNAVLEAISCQCPIIVSDIPQHMEVLKEIDGCGRAYKLGNINMLASILSGLNKNSIAQMRANCSKINRLNLQVGDLA